MWFKRIGNFEARFVCQAVKLVGEISHVLVLLQSIHRSLDLVKKYEKSAFLKTKISN